MRLARRRPTRIALWLILAGLLSLSGCGEPQIELHGAGATFPAPIYARWRALFHRQHPGISVHYRAVGSGRGIEAITERRVDFGASDALPTQTEVRAFPDSILAIPTVIGPVVVAYNLPRLEGDLTLSGELLAAIYLGEIKRWSDPRIAAVNPELELPSLPIRVAHRRDSSGTTHVFTDYLSAVSAPWREGVGRGKEVLWPTGDDWAGEGNDGVAHRILLEPGGIGYLELTYARNAGLKYAALINRAGLRVWPTPESVIAADENTQPTPGTYLKPSIVNAPGESSYPIAAFTYLLVYQDQTGMEPGEAHALNQFLQWILTEGQAEARKLHYAPLSDAVRTQALREIASIRLPEEAHEHE